MSNVHRYQVCSVSIFSSLVFCPVGLYVLFWPVGLYFCFARRPLFLFFYSVGISTSRADIKGLCAGEQLLERPLPGPVPVRSLFKTRFPPLKRSQQEVTEKSFNLAYRHHNMCWAGPIQYRLDLLTTFIGCVHNDCCCLLDLLN